MFGFLVKKAFFDMWDHMLTIFLLNIGFVLVLAGGLYLPTLLSFSTPISMAGFAWVMSEWRDRHMEACTVPVRNPH